MSLPHTSQTHIPFDWCRRCSCERVGSNLGPPREAAVIWPATPTMMKPSCPAAGPIVGLRHSGLEQRCPARAASLAIVGFEKSSLTDYPYSSNSCRELVRSPKSMCVLRQVAEHDSCRRPTLHIPKDID